jgi:LmbE family N-acetylglucosaminyl deacetylase
MRNGLEHVRRVLVVAPHPDDEAIGAWGLMDWLRARGAHIAVLVVSDGAASHPGSPSWPTARLVAERRRETLRALRRLGVVPPDIAFLGLADGALDRDPLLVRRVLGRHAASSCA